MVIDGGMDEEVTLGGRRNQVGKIVKELLLRFLDIIYCYF